MDTDRVLLRNLSTQGIVGPDGWGRAKPQPLSLSLDLGTSVSVAGAGDDLNASIDYSGVCKAALKVVEEGPHETIGALAEKLSSVVLSEPRVSWTAIRLELPWGLLHAKSIEWSISRSRASMTYEGAQRTAKMTIKDLAVTAIIGVNACEREEKQRLNVTLSADLEGPLLPSHPAYHRSLANLVQNYVETTTFQTVEALVTEIAKLVLSKCRIPKISVRVEKPSALTFAQGAGVEITREASFFNPLSSALRKNAVILGLGTNIGDRTRNIQEALRLLEKSGQIVSNTSFLYETPPMYVTDQPLFLNAACQLDTDLDPQALLVLLKDIEKELGRDMTALRNHPRVIDLDILFFNDQIFSSGTLSVPHPKMTEREFVLRPICE